MVKSLSQHDSGWLRLRTVLLASLCLLLSTLPHGIQNPSSLNPSSPTAFLLFPEPFETLPSHASIPVLAVAILPLSSSLNYTFGSVWLMTDDALLPLFPLHDQPLYDPQTDTFLAFYWGLIEGLPEGAVLLHLYSLFIPLSPDTEPFGVNELRLVMVTERGCGGRKGRRKQTS